MGGVIGLIGMSVMLIFFTARNTRRLYLEERITRERIADEQIMEERIR